jgi:hypothetical protein
MPYFQIWQQMQIFPKLSTLHIVSWFYCIIQEHINAMLLGMQYPICCSAIDTLVVYGYSSVSVCGGGARWCYRKSRDRKGPWTGVARKYVLRIPGIFPRFILIIAVVQVPCLLEVTESHVSPSGFPWVCAGATRSCAIFALAGPFDRKWKKKDQK